MSNPKRMKFKKFSKIGQYRNVVQDVLHRSTYVGLDENGSPVYDTLKPKPVITFTGTVKLHGTNAGICIVDSKGKPHSSFMGLKRTSLINSGHMGFGDFIYKTEVDKIAKFTKFLYDTYSGEDEYVAVYGEWAGKGIQKGVAISELDKAFYIFDVVSYTDVEKATTHDLTPIKQYLKDNPIDNVYTITEFPTYTIDIDFDRPDKSVELLQKLTEEVETECPVAKQLGNITGTGEGIVWRATYKGQELRMKIKGEKHSTSKVKTLAPVDTERLDSIRQFVDYAVTSNRVDQFMSEYTKHLDKSSTPVLLRWMYEDITSEEADVLKDNGFEWKDVAKDCNDRARRLFFDKLDSLIGL